MSKAKESKKSGLTADEQASESKLQAVVLADSFNKRFRPLTLEKPRCLLTLANTPLLGYTFEFLALAGVQDVIVFCCAHADQIEEYVRNSKWKSASSPFESMHVRASPTSMSVGDVMRELDLEGLINSDFLLVSGDIISNIPLEGVLQAHRERRAKSKDAIMTMVLRQSSASHKIRAKGESGVFVLDKTGTRCLQYEEFRPHTHHGRKGNVTSIPAEILKLNHDVQIRHDLIDCQIDILSPDVPPLFTENFDYQQIRKDFVRGILTDELYGKTIHTHIISNNYAARVRSLHLYESVCRDVICRWTYPFCPDSNLAGQSFHYTQGHIYRENGVVLAQSCTIGHRTVMGAESTVADEALIKHSVIGRNCTIGKNSVLENSHVWDNVVIGEGCRITGAIIGDNVTIQDGVTIEEGAIVSYGVVIGKGMTIPKKARITRFKRQDKSMDDGTQVHVVGEGGDGYEYQDSDEDESDDEETDETAHVYKSPSLNISVESMSDLSEENDDVAVDGLTSAARLMVLSPGGHARRPSQVAAVTAEEMEDDAFYREAFVSLLNSMEKDHPVEIIALELNSLRMTANAPFSSLRRATASAIATRVEQVMSSRDPPMLVGKAAEAVLPRLTMLFKRMIFDVNDQKDMLLWMQKDVAHRQKGGAILQATAMSLYKQDVLSEEGVLRWHGSMDAQASDELRKAREGCKQFIEFLTEDSEEEDDSEEESEEESDDE